MSDDVLVLSDGNLLHRCSEGDLFNFVFEKDSAKVFFSLRKGSKHLPYLMSLEVADHESTCSDCITAVQWGRPRTRHLVSVPLGQNPEDEDFKP